MPDHTSFDDALRLHRQGHIDEAESAYRKILAADAGHPGALHLLGVIRQQQGRHEEALELIGRAIAINPGKAVYHNNYGAALLSLERFAEAAASFQRALAIRPPYADALANLGLLQTLFDEERAAENSFRQALEIQPWHRDATVRLAGLLGKRGQDTEARQLLDAALAAAPCGEFHAALGNVLFRTGFADQAAQAYRAAIERRPDDALAHFNLANALEELHDTDGRRRHFARATELRPDRALWRLRAEICGPVVFENAQEIEEYCARVDSAIHRTRHAPGEGMHHAERDEYGLRNAGLNDILEAGVFPGFSLSYHGRDQRRLKEQFAALYEPCFRDQPPPAGSGLRDRKQVGILVTRRHEGIFLRCMRGIIQRLDAERFETVILCPRASLNRLRQSLPPDRLRFVTIDESVARAVSQIRAAACDLIYYWEVGSDAVNYFLPFARLAPVQCTSHGSLTTTGVPAVDWFFSSDLMETDAADGHYSERLWRSRTLLMFQERLPPVKTRPRSAWGLPENGRLYACLQNPLKLHPDFDVVLAGILATDPAGTIVLLADQFGHVAAALRKRFAKRISEATERIIFVPRQKFEDYCALLQAADVLLDPFPYGAGSSCYDVFSFNLPLVTMPTPMMPGRVSSAFYKKMQFEELVASSPEEYVSKAVQVATDREYRRYVTQRIAEKSDVLFNDVEAVREHERFFEEAIAHAR